MWFVPVLPVCACAGKEVGIEKQSGSDRAVFLKGIG